MRQGTGSAWVQVMACRLFGAKPSPEPILFYGQLDFWQQISVKFESEFYHFLWRKCIWNCRLPTWRPFCPGGDKLSYATLSTICMWQKVINGTHGKSSNQLATRQHRAVGLRWGMTQSRASISAVPGRAHLRSKWPNSMTYMTGRQPQAYWHTAVG